MNRTLTRRMAFIEQFDLMVGIDLAKGKNDAIIIDRRLAKHGRFQFAHSQEEYDKLKCWLKRGRAGIEQPRILVSMEPTNDYWQWLAAFFEEEGIAYRLVNPFTVKKSREGSQLDYAKDDQRDAFVIARLLCEGKFTETQLQPEPYAQMRQYEQSRWKLRESMRQHKTMLRQQVERLFPELRLIFKDFTGKTITALLQSHADPHKIATMSWETFESGVRQDFVGSQLMVKKLRQVYEVAPYSIGLQPGNALQHLIRQETAMMQFQQQQLASLEAELLTYFYTLPIAPYLLSLGLGELTTALVVAELGELNRFRSPKQLVKLAGIQPTPNSSGQQRRRKTPMSHKGRVRLRTDLFFATMRLLRTDEAFQSRRDKFINRQSNPLKRIEAVGALMNKLLHLIWVVYRQETMYDPHRFMAA